MFITYVCVCVCITPITYVIKVAYDTSVSYYRVYAERVSLVYDISRVLVCISDARWQTRFRGNRS